ncbi:MAG: HlyC/CorC family transporter [Pseudomonadales bacterium]|jgi:Mg2+/Co2+ transporter CorB|nr:HlyC/CorC family transporter [Pseudomonadales bacterium]MDP6471652.1 HlyC/CorC family transporter [Pseudomonadales bacterium]MDP6973062.1 HlyC/CorC family transporter [Pseudomonadales bacterium]
MSLDQIPAAWLFSTLAVLTILSAYFSGTETAMMALNRYRLVHLVKEGHGGARKAARLLRRPDRLLGVILIGNNLVNFMAASIGTVIGLRYFGDSAIVITPIVLTLFFLIFAEVAPKTIAAHLPERIAFASVYILDPLLRALHPFVWFINAISNFLVRPVVPSAETTAQRLTPDELRTVVDEGAHLPGQHHDMMLSILDLENVTVNDIMVPRSEIIGIDIEDDMEDILAIMASSQHTRLPVYKENINDTLGMLHLRRVARYVTTGEITKAELLQLTREPYYVPEATPLHTQLINFQKEKRRIALVVDEYGDVDGIVALEDILEEIVGEFTTDFAANMPDIQQQQDGWYLIDGTTVLRDINRALGWNLPTTGPKTLNGLVLEHLETLPESNLGLQIGTYRFETLQIKDNLIKHIKVSRVQEL